jgi:hypothetical protein
MGVAPHGGFLYLTEDVFHGMGGMVAAMEFRLPMVAVPHNVDSTSAGGFCMKASFANLELEMELLSKCDDVFSISAWDSWLHSQFGIFSKVLPYYPPSVLMGQLLLRRVRRESFFLGSAEHLRTGFPGKSPIKFLIPGSAHNPPTRAGLVSLLGFLASRSWADGVEFHVVGRGSENLLSGVTGTGVSSMRMHGYVAQETFEDLLVSSHAVISHQDQGSGALTRVMDSLVSGVPVIASRVASRGWDHISNLGKPMVSSSLFDQGGSSGLFSYGTFHSLGDLVEGFCLMNSPAGFITPLPPPPVKEENLFLNSLSMRLLGVPWVCKDIVVDGKHLENGLLP